jgi:ACS family hexuronate transporter-like MFS transporter
LSGAPPPASLRLASDPPPAVTLPSSFYRLRWAFLTLTFVVTMVGYADRQVLALLKPALDAKFGWSGQDYGNMTTAFQIAIAVSLVWVGWFLDKVGLRAGFATGLGGWSLAASLHAIARTVPEFIAARASLGVFEAIGTPAGMKALATFFRAEERALVIGVTNIAPNVATMVTPLIVSALYVAIGWQLTIVALGAFGFLCLALWLALPLRRMEQQAQTGLPQGAPLADDHAATHPVWQDKTAWLLAAVKALTDQAWWFFLFFLPDFMHRRFHLDLGHLGAPVATIYALAATGSVMGGLLPRLLTQTGLSPARARATAMLIFALLVAPVTTLTTAPALWPTVALLGLALAAHQGFSVNVFAQAADMVPATRIGRVIAFAALAGNLAGAASAHAAGWMQTTWHTLAPMFFVCAAGYPLAWLILAATGAFRPK